MSSSKRADLQGIRGLAILAVLLFHFFPTYFPNGYIGVDQFFVLSGFLISMILSRKEVSLDGMYMFYYRRVKRIVPMYLFVVVFVLISLFTVFPRTNLETNIDSAWNALLFYTNMAETSDDNKYEISLMLAQDAFTHTWSLAVEMQFYLLVPFIFLVGKDRIWRMLVAVVSLSLSYSLLTDTNTSFNSVLARLWQFCIGAIANILCEDKPKSAADERCRLIEEKGIDVASDVHSSHTGQIAVFLLFLAMFQEFFPIAVPSPMLRITSTLLTAAIIIIGGQVQISFLSHRSITYLGDISYSLYLVHWPIYTYVKLEHSHSVFALFVGFLVSVIIAVILTESFERFYLGLNGTYIAILLIILYSLNFGILLNQQTLSHLTSPYKEAEDLEKSFKDKDVVNPNARYDNITAEQAIKLNNLWIIENRPSLTQKSCIPRKNNEKFHDCDFNDSHNKSGPTAVIIGNSYAGNIGGVLNEECRDFTSSMTRFWINTCDVLCDVAGMGAQCIDVTRHYLPRLQRIKPDVLFMITRHIGTMKPLTNPNVSEDTIFLEAQRRLALYEKVVKKRIFILDATPQPEFKGVRKVINGLKTGRMPAMKQLIATGDYEAARLRMSALLKSCEKCRLIDYTRVFMKDGEFQMYDREHGLIYFNTGAHLTPLAREKIRPVLRESCESLREL